MSSNPKSPGKRLIVCCDGTWMDSVGTLKTPTNVTRICRCIKTEGFDPIGQTNIPQVVYYQAGVGSNSVSPGFKGHIAGGLTGEGIAENIREAYVFLCNNYNPGDEIFLIGFSRGAFTARSVSTLVRAIGLLTRKGLVYLYQIFQDWEHQDNLCWKSPYAPWPGQPNNNVNSDEYRREMQAAELSRYDIPIKACGVWDTVGALGVPAIGLLPRLFRQRLSFVNTQVEPIIEHAFQALALDEMRRPFSPTVWEKPDGQENPKVLKQCWFPGTHSDIGGGWQDAEMANITLAWMMSQLEGMIEFDRSYILEQQDLTIQAVRESGQPLRGWGFGRIHNSFTPMYWLTGRKVRTPCDYYAVTREWTSFPFGIFSFPTSRTRLRNTRQFVHASVRVRLGCEGPGYNDKGVWQPPALQGWKWEADIHDDEAGNHRLSRVRWSKQTGQADEPVLSMEEDELGDLEKILLKNWSPRIYDTLPSLTPDPPSGRQKKSVTLPKDKVQDPTVNGNSVDTLIGGEPVKPKLLDREVSATL